MAWDKEKIAEGILAPDLNDEIRANWAALEAALDAWAYFATGGVQTGRPRPGSARPYFQDSAPTARLDGDYFTSDDYGTVWIDSNATIDNQFNILTAADGAGTETWTPISTEVIAVLVAAVHTWAAVQTFSEIPVFTKGLFANDAYLTARNAAGDGNVDLIKADGSDVPTVPDDAANATSGAPTADASLANKKYVDDQLLTGITLSAYTNLDSESNAMVVAHAYKAATAGRVFVSLAGIGTAKNIIGYVGLTNDPAGAGTMVALKACVDNDSVSFSMDVAKDEYFEITTTSASTPTLLWKSIGTLSAPVDQD